MGSQNDSRVAEAEQARQRLVQEREAARASRLFLGGSNPTPPSGASAGVSPITGDQAITRPIADAEASQASNNGVPAKARSDERRVGKERDRTGRPRGWP